MKKVIQFLKKVKYRFNLLKRRSTYGKDFSFLDDFTIGDTIPNGQVTKADMSKLANSVTKADMSKLANSVTKADMSKLANSVTKADMSKLANSFTQAGAIPNGQATTIKKI